MWRPAASIFAMNIIEAAEKTTHAKDVCLQPAMGLVIIWQDGTYNYVSCLKELFKN
jgi:hypothetical protein